MSKKIVTLGEIMLRLSPPGYERFLDSTRYEAFYGGCEANIAISLSMLGHDVEYLTKLPNNELGQAAINSLRSYGVETKNILRGGDRIGLYFSETGASIRASKVIYDRKHSSFSESSYEEYNFDKIFEDKYLYQISGISPALSEKNKDLILKSAKKAHEMGLIVSYDYNYRSNLWSREESEKFLEDIIPYVDILIGYIPSWDGKEVDHSKFKESFIEFYDKYNLKIITSTLRESISASDNKIKAIMYDGKDYIISDTYDIRIVNRIGGGDAFTAGILSEYIYGSKSGRILEFGVAADAWKHTIYSDYNIATKNEIEEVLKGNKSGNVKR